MMSDQLTYPATNAFANALLPNPVHCVYHKSLLRVFSSIHVRRTDKVGTEAAFHSIEEYMKHVHAWYDKYELRASKERSGEETVRRVYIASDDPAVLPEAQEKWVGFVFLNWKLSF